MRSVAALAAFSSAALIVTACSSSPSETAPTAAPDATAAATEPEPGTTTAGDFPLPTYVAVAGDDEPDPFPAGVDGYVPDGDVERYELRVFGNGIAAAAWDSALVGSCDATYWILRWRDLSDASILASTGSPFVWTVFADGINPGPVLSDLEDRGPPVGTRGYLTGFGCEVPVFGRPPSSFDGSTNVLSDVVIEVQRYRPGVDASGEPVPEFAPGPPTEPATPIVCDSYDVWLDVPFLPCSSGLIVGRIQDRLIVLGFDGVTVDNEFGPSTMAAVIELQRENGLIPDGIVGSRTWTLLMEDAWYPSQDLDGNDRLSPNELVFD